MSKIAHRRASCAHAPIGAGTSMHRSNWPAAPVISQIYPPSFKDSTGDGIRDLKGITSKLEHVAGLCTDATWRSPFYLSDWADGGYDVIDHTAVDPMVGSEADFDALVARALDLGLPVMIDQVLNHTSDKHPWFQAARLHHRHARGQRHARRHGRHGGSRAVLSR